jgi:succinyl-CoA synthetase alpha subunit
VRNAALEAIDAGIKLLVIIPDRVPIYDVLEIVNAAKKAGANFVGPNTLGVLSPGKAVLGMIGGRAASARSWFYPGPVGIVSRSGGITSSMAYYLAQEGIGATTLVHVGGDVIVGSPIPDVIQRFQADPETKAIVMFGEIGGSQEECVADLIDAGTVDKPIVAFIGGKAAKRGTRFSHAGAIIEGSRGTHEGKVKRLREVDVTVVEAFGALPEVTADILKQHGIKHE